MDPSLCPGGAVQQRTDWCPIQAVMSWHHFWPLFFFKSWGRRCSLWGLPDCWSHLPQSHLGKLLWGLAAVCHRTAWTTYLDFQVKLASVVTWKKSALFEKNINAQPYIWWKWFYVNTVHFLHFKNILTSCYWLMSLLLFQGLCHWSHIPL